MDHCQQSYGFPVVMYGCESWTIKKTECQRIDELLSFWTEVLEKTLESPLNCREIKPVRIKGNQPWIVIERTHTEAEAPILWPPDAKNWLFGKDPGSGKDWWQEEKEKAEDEMVEWHHRLDGHEFEQAPGDGGGQGSLMCCSPWGLKQLDMTEWLKLLEGMMCYIHNIMIIWSLYYRSHSVISNCLRPHGR